MTLSVLLLWSSVASADTTPELTRTRSGRRNLDCERVSAQAGSDRYPGRIVVSESRAAPDDQTVVICQERLARPGLRAPRDEAVLSSLQTLATEIAVAAATSRPDLRERTWLVESFTPSQPVAAKVSFATKNALMGQGVRVSDRTPKLGAGDVDVLVRLPPFEAYPAACRRWFATGGLGEGDALLAVVNLDPRETVLHAGVCTGGGWTWLQ
jgi:hypothetical protein